MSYGNMWSTIFNTCCAYVCRCLESCRSETLTQSRDITSGQPTPLKISHSQGYILSLIGIELLGCVLCHVFCEATTAKNIRQLILYLKLFLPQGVTSAWWMAMWHKSTNNTVHKMCFLQRTHSRVQNIYCDVKHVLGKRSFSWTPCRGQETQSADWDGNAVPSSCKPWLLSCLWRMTLLKPGFWPSGLLRRKPTKVSD